MKNKKLGKISKITKTRISSPYDEHKTQWSGVAVLMHWMRNIIESKNLDLGLPDVETKRGDGKRPDTVIYKSRRSQNVLCEMEFERPFFDPFASDLKENARKKATDRHAKYFTTSNFKELILWNTEKVNAQKSEEEQIVGKYHLSEMNDLDFVEDARYRNSIITNLEKFLTDLYEISTGAKAEPRLAIDEFLIWRLQEKIKKLAHYYQNIIYDQAHKDNKFTKVLRKWFSNQGWSFSWQDSDFDKIARQTAYLLANKILFYNALQSKQPDKLDRLRIPKDVTKGGLLQSVLQGYFNEVLKIDYETIYTTDFIDQIAFPDNREVVEEIKDLIDILQRYDFSTLGFDIIGRVFERLIPENERHNLGQYFTNPDIVDLILRFCLQHENDKVLDPSCGAGTFLVRAYQHKKLMNQRLTHEEILEDLWGSDIAKFPAHLATINLAINDLSSDKNYPNIIQEDFFNFLTKSDTSWLPEKGRKARTRSLGKEEREIRYPRYFTCVVGNPPYTRQEEIGEISPENLTYKESLVKKALFQENKQLAEIPKRAGIYAYFFIHGTKFLQNGGKFGFIVSNAWLDVDYGRGLQEFFLNNYKITTIIESKVERWFEEAGINTCLIILDKCSGEDKKKERDENLVRFVYLKKPLHYFIPPAQDIWEKQVQRLQSIDKLIKTILAHDELYKNEDLRIFPKKQKELWEEGFNFEENRYDGSKWGKYLKAPDVFFRILKKGNGRLVPLKKIAQVKRGFTTGANDFFYLTESEIKRRKIEKEFWMHKDKKRNWVPNYVIKSPRECKSVTVNPRDLKFRALMINKDKKDLKGSNILSYIQEGERKGYHKRPTCESRGERWYELSQELENAIIFRRFFDVVYNLPLIEEDTFVDQTFYFAVPKDSKDIKIMSSILNSTIQWFFIELLGRYGLGEGVLQYAVYEEAQIATIDPAIIKKKTRERLIDVLETLAKRNVLSVFKEINAQNSNEVSLEKVMSDRRELDKIVMGEILGLTNEEQLEVYRAFIDLVKSRVEKAKSFGKKKKTKTGIDIDALVNIVLEKIGENTLRKFYKEKILNRKDLVNKKLPELKDKPKIKKGLFGWQLSSGKDYIECSSKDEARYLRVWLETGIKSIEIPKNKKHLEKITSDLEKLKSNIDEIIEDYLDSIIDRKLKNQIFHQIWQNII